MILAFDSCLYVEEGDGFVLGEERNGKVFQDGRMGLDAEV
jgi:hypothetical protein